jgi:PAS domain S-box-containing protein
MPKPTDELYRTVVALLPVGALVVDHAGRVVVANKEAERVFGREPGQLSGLIVAHLVADADRGRLRGHVDEAHIERDIDALVGGGAAMAVDIQVIPFAGDGERLALLVVFDASERRKLQDERRHFHKLEAIGTLAQGVAHDFNNILRAIVGYVELARESVRDAQAVEDLARVRQAADRGQRLVERILAFSPQRELTRTATPLDKPVREALEELRHTLPPTTVIRSRLATDTPMVRADEAQVHDVLVHLATTGMQASGAQSTIDVTLTPFAAGPEFERMHPGSPAGPYARVAVSVTRMAEASDVRDEALGDPSVGLAIVSGIVRGLGGVVDVESRAGQGTTIVLYFPASPGHVQRGAAAGAPAGDASADLGPHILLVEDEETLAELGRRQLQADGFNVTVHTSSIHALEDFRARPDAFDLVITDNTMPKMSGMALAHEILRVRPRIPILLVSGLAETLDPGVIYAKGIAGLLGKPHTGQELTAAVRSLLELTDRRPRGEGRH